MPRRDAVSRSMTRRACSPRSCWSLATSRSSGKAAQLFHQPRRPDGQFLGVGIFEAVLILRAADPVFDGEILHRLHEQRDALDSGELRLQAANDVAGADLPLLNGLQIDLHAPAVERRVGAIDADERRQAFHRRVLQNHARQRLLALRHGGEGNALRRLGNAQNDAGVLHREKALGDDNVKSSGAGPVCRRPPSRVAV